jgi:prophage DNA circulation protein
MDNNYLEHYYPVKRWKNKFNNAMKEVKRLKNELNKKTNTVNNLTKLYNASKDGLTKATQETVRLG